MSEQNVGEQAPEFLDATVVVRRLVACPVKQVWKVLMSKEGAEALLGPGAALGQKGNTWRADDGRSGVIRSLHPLEEVRFSFRLDDKATPSVVELTLEPQDASTLLTVTHSRLTTDMDVSWLSERWEAALGRIEACVSD
ncbi:MAG: SRPBCC domain-containing protein [Actinomycetia bacterium]|nr:SRPBCC domain-containing protein [Actinomycetes bacterium]